MQPIYRQSQYRNTAVHQPGRAPQVNLPTPDTRHLTEAAAAMVDHADALESTLIDDIEYSTSLVQQDSINEIVTHAQNDFLRRSSLPDGVDDSWYDQQGIFRETDFRTWENQQLAAITATIPTKGFMRPESKLKAAEFARSTRDKLQQQFTAQLAAAIPQRALMRFQKSYKNLIAQGQYAAAGELIAATPDSVMNQQDKDALAYETYQKQLRADIDSAPSVATLIDLRDDPDFYDSLDDDNKDYLSHRLREQNRTESTPAGKEYSIGKNGRITARDTLATAPAAAPSYVQSFILKHNGKPAETLQGTREAMDILYRFGRDTITAPNDIRKRAELRTLAKAIGINESDATAVWEQISSELTADGSVPAQKIISAIPDEAWLFNTPDLLAEHQANVTRLQEDIAYAKTRLKDDKVKDNEEKRTHFENQIATSQKQLDSLKLQIAAQAEQMRAATMTEYNAWLDQGGKGKTYHEQGTILNSCIIRRTTALPESFAKDLRRTFETAHQAHQDKLADANKRHEEYKHSEQAIAEARLMADIEAGNFRETFTPTTLQVTAPAKDIRLTDTNTQHIIYVPKGTLPTGKILKFRTSRDIFPIEVVEDPRIQSVHLSNKLRQDFDFLDTLPAAISISGDFLIFKPDYYPENTETSTEAGQVSQTNELFPDDGLVPIDEYEYSEEDGMPISDLPL